MKIIRAEHLGMCFGVRDAIALAQKQSQENPLTILGDLVHNETVLADLTSRGIVITSEPENIASKTVLVTAHGASEKRKNLVKARGHTVLEATCPLVHVAHRAVTKFVAAGYHPVIIGKRGHVEVRGLTEDLSDFDIVVSEADVYQLRKRERFGIAAQTTQPIQRVRQLVDLIRAQFPDSEVLFADTVCQPTKQRQSSAVDLAQKSSVVIVIGGAHSNNTHELLNACSQHCSRVYHVQTAADLRPDWFADSDTIGITAGTSTPDSSINEIESWLQTLERSRLEAIHGFSLNDKPSLN